MSLKKNTIANYIGQGYLTLINIVMLPLYLRYLGAESYGLVGFFAVMQAWLQLLDAGLSPTLARQVAYERGRDAESFTEVRHLLRSIELIFLVLGILMGLGIWFASPWIASRWLDVKTLPLTEVGYCISLMGFIIGLRWLASLYRSGIQGMEHQVWLNVANIALSSLRYVGAWVLLRWITQEVSHFFEFQICVSIIELAVLATKFYRTLPSAGGRRIGFSFSSLKAVLPFTASVAYASGIWILLTQLDKLILSHVLSLKEYGYFALVAVVATGILSFTGPISQALLPRMTVLLSNGNEKEMLTIYRKSTQFVAALIFPMTGLVALFSTEMLYAWTGDRIAAKWAGPVLTWFVLGNGILAISTFQYSLQFAHGKLKLHVMNSTVSALVQVPIIIFAAFKYGVMGVAISWFATRLITFFIWPPIIHHYFAPGIHKKWLLEDLAPVFIMTCIMMAIAGNLRGSLNTASRIEIVAALGFFGVVALFANLLVSRLGRESIFRILKLSRSVG